MSSFVNTHRFTTVRHTNDAGCSANPEVPTNCEIRKVMAILTYKALAEKGRKCVVLTHRGLASDTLSHNCLPRMVVKKKPSSKSPAGWWFEPLWKIWKSIGMISNPIYGKIKLMATKPPTSQYLIVVIILKLLGWLDILGGLALIYHMELDS